MTFIKRLCLIWIFCILGFHIFAEDSFFEGSGGKNHTIMFANSYMENGIFDKSDEWVCLKVKENLISTMNRFGGFKCIDMAATKEIIKVQKELDSSVYDDNYSIEIGRLVKAKEVISITTTRLSSGSYSMTVTLFNVETGTILGKYSSPKVYESADSFAIQAHYDCIPFMLSQLGVKQTLEGKKVLQEELKVAKKQVEENRKIAKENAKLEAERTEKAERQAKIAAEERAKKEAAEKAEYEANQKALAAKKAQEAAVAAAAKKRNPFIKETYAAEFENGSRYDKYVIKFTGPNECTVTLSSENSKGEKNEVTASGSYVYQDEMLSITVRMKNDKIKHVQKINWKGVVSFKNGFDVFYYMIPVSSKEESKKIRVEFLKK